MAITIFDCCVVKIEVDTNRNLTFIGTVVLENALAAFPSSTGLKEQSLNGTTKLHVRSHHF